MSKSMTIRENFALRVSSAEEAFKRLGLEDKFSIECSYAKQIAIANETLYRCDGVSITMAIANVALTGLTLDPVRKLAYLIPRGGKCILQPSYRGLMKSVTSTGSIIGFEAKVVYDGDVFDFQEGSDPYIRHTSLDLKENLSEEEKQKITARSRNPYAAMRCAYSVAILPGGSRTFVIMPKWRIDKIRDVAKGTDKPTSPWNKWPEEQVRKTVLAYHTKTLDVGESAANAVQLFHDNDGIRGIADEVTGGLLAALNINEIKPGEDDMACSVCENKLGADNLCHNSTCPEGVPE